MASVLIVDDAAFSRRIIRKFLQSDAYQIYEASNGREAFALIDQHAPTLLLVDLLMPDMTGFELLAHLQQQGSPIPTVIISADVQEASRQQGYELGAVAFLNKPVKAAELQQVVHRYFSQVG